MTTYDDHADLLGEPCEYCGEPNALCRCDFAPCPHCGRWAMGEPGCKHCDNSRHGFPVTGGALPTKEALEARMRELGMLDPTHDERQADLDAVFGVCPDCRGLECSCDPEQQEFVISG